MPAPPNPDAEDDRLEAWKDIAAFFGREVRTVQGWEKNEGLPVHRHQHARQGSVYAFKSELEAWRQRRAISPEAPETAVPLAPAETIPSEPTKTVPKSWIWIGAGCALALAVSIFYALAGNKPAPPTSVVVLPFVDMSPAKDQEYFSDGLTEEIIDTLSRVPNLRVVARTSAFAYKGRNSDIRAIASQLNVDSVLEGSVRKSGDQLRITAQFNRARDGFHYWSQTYDRPLKDVFAVQRDISQAIASQMRAGEVAHRQPTSDLEAYRLFSEGRFFFNQFTPESFLKAIERYQQAIARDAKFALAYAGLANAYSYLAEFTISPPNEVMPKAREAAQKAVDLDPGSGEAHTALGLVKLDYEWDRPAAEGEFSRAAAINPGSGWAHHWLGHLRETQGRLEDAIAEMKTARSFDPLSPPIYWDLSMDLAFARRYDEASAIVDKGIELFPSDRTLFLVVRARIALEKGDRAAVEKLLPELNQAQETSVGSAHVLALQGVYAARYLRRADADQALRKLEERRRKGYLDASCIVETCMALNDASCVQKWLKLAYLERSALFVYLPLYSGGEVAKFPAARELLAHIR